MPVKLVKKTLKNKYFQFNAIAFIPETQCSVGALFTHGYTASKTDCINWAQRLCESNITSVIFDLPGHHLGSYNSINSFEDFRDHSHECFETAFEFLAEVLDSCDRLALGGHSLGALLAMKALNIERFQSLQLISIGVGFGISQHKTAHLFETSFYEKTLDVRRQLVDSNLDSDKVFPWIKEAKMNLDLTGRVIYLVTGEDDVVVGEGGMEALAFKLIPLQNEVRTHKPKKLPHHQPAAAATWISRFITDFFIDAEKDLGLKVKDS